MPARRAKLTIGRPPSLMRWLTGVTTPARDGGAVDLRQNRVEGRALPVAGDEDGNGVLIRARMPGLAASLAKPCAEARSGGP